MDNYQKLFADNYDKILDYVDELLLSHDDGGEMHIFLRKTGEVASSRSYPKNLDNWIILPSVTLYSFNIDLDEFDNADAQDDHIDGEMTHFSDRLRGMMNELW